MEPILKLLLQPFQVRTGRGWNSGDKTLPALRCSICCWEVGRWDADEGKWRLTGSAEIGGRKGMGYKEEEEIGWRERGSKMDTRKMGDLDEC